MTALQNIGVVGAGAWGTALSCVLRRAGRKPLLWAHRAETARAINQHHENRIHMPGVAIDEEIAATSKLAELASCDAWILATPAQHTREICRQLRKLVKGKGPVIVAAKGIEQGTAALLSAMLAEELPGHPVAILTGPSFAIEVARDLPAALTLASADRAQGEDIVRSLGTPHFRLYLTDDVVGAQIGGAIKNVVAVACGIVAGRNLGENARAALITRGLAEMTRLGTAMGARAETLAGLSGLGDLVLTCSSLQSRNMSLGAALAQGISLADILAARASVTEGVYTAAGAALLAQKYNVEMPIVRAVNAILNEGAMIDDVIENLLARPFRSEAA